MAATGKMFYWSPFRQHDIGTKTSQNDLVYFNRFTVKTNKAEDEFKGR